MTTDTTSGSSIKERFIYVLKRPIRVTEELYQLHSRFSGRERYLARRNGKCGQSDYRRCRGDCFDCRWYQEGFNMLSFNKAFGNNCEHENDELSAHVARVDEIVADKMLLEELYRKLDELIPNGAQVFKMRAQEYPERDIAKAVGTS